jgi:hypothetical protein
VITQSKRPLAFFSKKISVQQQKYNVTKIELLAIVEKLKEFKGMLWGQRIKVYTDQKIFTWDALGLNSDRVYWWRLILEEYGLEIVYIKEIHNTVADAISRLEYISAKTPSEVAAMHQNWTAFSKCWCEYKQTHDCSKDKHNYSMNNVFANHSKEEEIYPLTVKEMAKAQMLDRLFKATTLKEKYEKTLIKNTLVFCKNGKLVISRSLQHRVVSWYHHYLQHYGNTCLEETLLAAMYWKQMRSTVCSYIKNWQSYYVNKRYSQKYGKLPVKLATITPWEAVCVDLIGPYMLHGKDGTEIDFMCLTMIDPASSWFQIVELLVVELSPTSHIKIQAKPHDKTKEDTLANLPA